MKTILVQKLRDSAILPRRATGGSAGYDLCADIPQPLLLAAHSRVSVPTGIAIAIEDPGCAAFVFARSGLAIKHGIAPSNAVGVIDSDYRGELLVGLSNHSGEDYLIQPGERVAQLLFLPVLLPELTLCESLPETARGAGGFGSTGKVSLD
jgi:dUTP pyrophosphatase